MAQMTPGSSPKRSPSKKSVTSRKIQSGLVITTGPFSRRSAYWGEVAALVGVIGFGAMAYGQWLWPGFVGSGDVLGLKIATTAAFFGPAVALYRIARIGLTTEVQLNSQNRTLSFVRRNKEGQATPNRRISFDEIESLFIRRGQSAGQPSRLFLKLRNGGRLLVLARAPTRELEPILEHLRVTCQNHQSPQRPVPRRHGLMARPATAI